MIGRREVRLTRSGTFSFCTKKGKGARQLKIFKIQKLKYSLKFEIEIEIHEIEIFILMY